jgi:exodeoxyribonuclease VII large subunit
MFRAVLACKGEVRLIAHLQDHLQRARDSVKRQQLKLALYRPEYRIANLRQTLADTEDRLHGILDRRLERERHRLGLLAAQLDRLSPLKRLGGGYAFVADEQDRAIVTVDDVENGDILHVTLRDGKVDAQVVKTEQATLPELS